MEHTFQPLFCHAHCAINPSIDPQWNMALPAAIKRRDPRIWQLAYAATARLFETTALRPRSIMLATALGALDETRAFLDGVFLDGFGSPRNFIASVHNSMAGKLALEFKIDGPNLTFCDGPNSLASALCGLSVLDNSAFPSLILIADETIPLLTQLIPHLSNACAHLFSADAQEGAVALLVDRENKTGALKFFFRGPELIGNSDPDDIGKTWWPKLNTHRYIPTSISSTSFIGPALAVAAALDLQQQVIVTSYSPAAKTLAAIALCQ